MDVVVRGSDSKGDYVRTLGTAQSHITLWMRDRQQNDYVPTYRTAQQHIIIGRETAASRRRCGVFQSYNAGE